MTTVMIIMTILIINIFCSFINDKVNDDIICYIIYDNDDSNNDANSKDTDNCNDNDDNNSQINREM